MIDSEYTDKNDNQDNDFIKLVHQNSITKYTLVLYHIVMILIVLVITTPLLIVINYMKDYQYTYYIQDLKPGQAHFFYNNNEYYNIYTKSFQTHTYYFKCNNIVLLNERIIVMLYYIYVMVNVIIIAYVFRVFTFKGIRNQVCDCYRKLMFIYHNYNACLELFKHNVNQDNDVDNVDKVTDKQDVCDQDNENVYVITRQVDEYYQGVVNDVNKIADKQEVYNQDMKINNIMNDQKVYEEKIDEIINDKNIIDDQFNDDLRKRFDDILIKPKEIDIKDSDCQKLLQQQLSKDFCDYNMLVNMDMLLKTYNNNNNGDDDDDNYNDNDIDYDNNDED